MKNIQNCLLAVLMLLATSSLLSAQGSVSGRVVDESGEALPSATVMLTSLQDSVLAGFALTDATGNFLIKNVNEGGYKLQATYLQYNNFKHGNYPEKE